MSVLSDVQKMIVNGKTARKLSFDCLFGFSLKSSLGEILWQ